MSVKLSGAGEEHRFVDSSAKTRSLVFFTTSLSYTVYVRSEDSPKPTFVFLPAYILSFVIFT